MNKLSEDLYWLETALEDVRYDEPKQALRRIETYIALLSEELFGRYMEIPEYPQEEENNG